MKQSLTNYLYEMLSNRKEWIHGGDLERYGMSLGYMADNVGRRLRELRKCGSVISELRLYNGKKTAWWKVNSETNTSKAVETVQRDNPQAISAQLLYMRSTSPRGEQVKMTLF